MVLWDPGPARRRRQRRRSSAWTGLRRDEVVGRHWSERADAGDFARLLGLIRGALQNHVGEATTTVTRADGTLFEIEVRYLPVHLGERRYALGIGRDVSERLQQERALQRSEAQYRGIFNASADALVLRDARFRIVDVNATYESMSGYARDEVLGVDRVLANPPATGAKIRQLHERALAGTPVALETELVRRDGLRYALELRGVPIEHRGEPHVLYIGRDITLAKRAQAALRDSEEQYRAIFNASADGLVLRDKDYRAVEVNPAYLAMSGFSRDEVLAADRVLTQRDEDDPTATSCPARSHPRRRERAASKPVGNRKDGSKFEVEVSAKPLHVPRRAACAVRGTRHQRATRGRSAQRGAGAAVAPGPEDGSRRPAHRRHRARLQQHPDQRHRLRRAGAGTREELRDATLQRQLGQAHMAAQRARDLIMQMLAFARRQRGERRPLALVPLVQQSLQLLRATLPSSAVVDFGAVDDMPTVLADPVQLEQVLFNLCINARDAIQGAGSIRVRLGWHRGPWRCASCRAAGEHASWVELSVADSGTGIAADVLDRIFEPFVSTKEVGRGSGMGLAMVHGIVHDHGGHVLVETRPGAGTVFRVVLPPAGVDVPRRRPGELRVGAGRQGPEALSGPRARSSKTRPWWATSWRNC
jgi:PAS domain S-box-containing protein